MTRLTQVRDESLVSLDSVSQGKTPVDRVHVTTTLATTDGATDVDMGYSSGIHDNAQQMTIPDGTRAGATAQRQITDVEMVDTGATPDEDPFSRFVVRRRRRG